MLGRVMRIILGLQTILFCFYATYPGRDTQVMHDFGHLMDFFGTYSCSLFFNIFFNVTFWIFQSVSSFLVTIFYALTDTVILYQSSKSPLTRKHGRWRNRSVFPSTLLILSTVALNSCQAFEFCNLKLHRQSHLSQVNRNYDLQIHKTAPF